MSGGAYSARQNGVDVAEGSGAFGQTTSYMCMEVRAISEAVVWLRDERYILAIFVTDYMCTLQKLHLGMHSLCRLEASHHCKPA